MTDRNPICHHQSASSATAWDKCQTLHRLAYREGIRVAEDSETLRVGTNWHKVHEVYYAAGSNLDAVIEHLNQQYADVPRYATPQEWALERQVLLTSFIAYLWYYQNDPIEVLASEVPFDLPIHNRSGLPLPISEVKRVGKIDHIIRWHGMVGSLERKSTTRDIGEGSDYWDMGQKDIQVSMYALAMRDMPQLYQKGYLEVLEGQSWGNTLYDVWKRPRTKPKMLTQAETLALYENRVYFGESFCPDYYTHDQIMAHPVETVFIGGEETAVEMGKKGFAIRETVPMYAARLMAEMQEHPEKFFQRKEIVRTDAELVTFRKQLYNRYLQQKYVERNEIWTENSKACRDPFPCAYIPICFGPGAEAVCDGKTTPDGFRRIFVDLTVNGNVVE